MYPSTLDADMLEDAALSYARRGWHVLPLWWPTKDGCACGTSGCDSAGKHPIAPLAPRGLYDATPAVVTVHEWWRIVPNANVGIRTGIESGLVVLDVDGEAGRRSLRAVVAAHHRLSARWTRTGAGGWHAYLGHPGVWVPNSAGNLGAGLDVRGDGGYVVAPPSLHTSGTRYRWVPPPSGVALPRMPRWLLHLVTPRCFGSPAPMVTGAPGAAYAAAALRYEAHDVAMATPGRRNQCLNRAAFKIGQLVGAGLLDETTVTVVLVAAGMTAGPGERKIRATVRRGLEAGMRRPRRL